MIHSISLITSVGETLSVKAAGSGPVVMLLHGFPLDGRMWTYQLEQLSLHCRCLVPELRGFGGSTASRPYQLSDLADDVEQARRHLAPDEQLHLVGLSMGGYVALEYWHKYSSRLRSLTLANTKPQADDQATKAARLAMAQTAREAGAWAAVQSMLPRLLAPRSLGGDVEQPVRAMMQSASPTAVAFAQQAMAERRDFSDRLAAIQVPTLVVTGQHDGLAPPAATRQWAEQLRMGRFEELSDAGHLTPMESPAQFNSVLGEFISSNG